MSASASRETALTQLASTFFDTPWVRSYLQTEFGWSDGSRELTSPHSIVASSAASGKSLSSPSHQLTVVDEEIIANMQAPEVLAIPVLMDESPDSCAAVILVGLTKARLMELAGQTKLIENFQKVARAALGVTTGASIDLDELDQLAREIIHEANNPLSTVQNYLKVLALKLGPDHEAHDTIETIGLELQRAATIIQRFRHLEPDQSNTHLPSNVNQVLAEQAQLFGHSLEIVTALDPQDPIALIEPDALKQIISNLMKNAGESGATRLSLRTSAGLQQNDVTYVEITVSDNGPGIETENNIFQRGVTTKDGDHAGQGLAVVKTLIENAEGILGFRTSAHGTEFRITIPELENR